MKKSVLAVAVLVSTSTFAQEKEYLPVAGDWAIGIDANPFLNYLGNFIGGGQNANSAPTWNFLTDNQTITGKYFAEDDMAYRAGIRIGFGSVKGSNMVTDRSIDYTDPLNYEYPNKPVVELENTWKAGYNNIGITVGLEKRKGYNRLQGFYGAELGLSFSSMSETYTYGNAFTQPTTGINVDFHVDDEMDSNNDGITDNTDTDSFGNDARILSYKSGMAVGIGLRGFIGVEYFVMPKISIGGEFGWGLVYNMGGTSVTEMESEGFDNTGTERTSTFTVESKNDSGFSLDTDNMNTVFGPAARLRMTFHF